MRSCLAALRMCVLAAVALICASGRAADTKEAAGATAGDEPRSTSLAPHLNDAALASCPQLGEWDFAFTSNADGDAEIYLYHAGGGIEKLTDNDVADHWASWSADGRELAFQSQRDGNREIYVLSLETGATRNVSKHAEQDLLPSWSPDGSTIAFFSSRDQPWSGEGPLGGHIFLMAPDGSNGRRVATDAFYSTSGIVWAPDGRSIVYARFGEGRRGLHRFDFDSNEERLLLTLADAAPGVAAYAPDGTALLYYLDHEGGADLFQLSFAGDEPQRVTTGGYHYYASWSPDGAALLTTSAQDSEAMRYDIRCMSLDGSVDISVIDDASDARAAVWRPAPPRE